MENAQTCGKCNAALQADYEGGVCYLCYLQATNALAARSASGRIKGRQFVARSLKGPTLTTIVRREGDSALPLALQYERLIGDDELADILNALADTADTKKPGPPRESREEIRSRFNDAFRDLVKSRGGSYASIGLLQVYKAAGFSRSTFSNYGIDYGIDWKQELKALKVRQRTNLNS